MNFKTISTIITILSLNLLALSSPLQSNKYSADITDISIDEVDNSQHVTFDIYSKDKAEATDVSSDNEEDNLIDTNDVEEVLDIDNVDEIETEIETEIENVCNTKECIEVANNLLDSIDTTVDPCDDFYQFTCGNYIKNHPVSEKIERIINFYSAESNIKENIINMLQNDYKPNNNLSKQEQENDKFLFNQLKNFFQSCIDVDTINKKGIKPMVDLLKKLKIEERKDKYNDPNELGITLAKLHSILIPGSMYNSLFNTSMQIKDNEIYILSLEKTYRMIDDEDINDMKMVLSNIFKDSEERNIDKMIDSVIEFENKLFEESNEEVDPYEIIDVKTLNEKYPNINWKSYLEERFDSVGMKEKINDDTPIYSSNIAYFKNLNKVLDEVDGETLSYYFEITIIEYFNDLLPYEFLPEDLKNTTSETDRVDYCYDIAINKYMPDLISRH